MAVSSRQVKNKRDSNGVLTGRPGTVYDVNIKYTAPDGKKKSNAKKGFATKKEATQHEAEMKTKLQNPGQIASITSQRKQTVASYLNDWVESPFSHRTSFSRPGRCILYSRRRLYPVARSVRRYCRVCS